MICKLKSHKLHALYITEPQKLHAPFITEQPSSIILKTTKEVATSGLDWNPDQIVVTEQPINYTNRGGLFG
jgi:hypothetical protein